MNECDAFGSKVDDWTELRALGWIDGEEAKSRKLLIQAISTRQNRVTGWIKEQPWASWRRTLTSRFDDLQHLPNPEPL